MKNKKHIKLFEEYTDSGEYKHPGFIKDRKKAEAWLDDHRIENYELSWDLKVSVPESVNLNFEDLEYFPLKFEMVDGNFVCNNTSLKSLIGSPRIVEGNFICNAGKLSTLKGSPYEVKGFFECNHNKLSDLNGSPKYVGGMFECEHNYLDTINMSTEKIGGSFNCNNNQLSDYLGIVSEIPGNLYCRAQADETIFPYIPCEVGGSIASDEEMYSDWFESVKNSNMSFDLAKEIITTYTDEDDNLYWLDHLYKKYGGEEKFWRIWSGYKMASHEDDDKLRDIGIWD